MKNAFTLEAEMFSASIYSSAHYIPVVDTESTELQMPCIIYAISRMPMSYKHFRSTLKVYLIIKLKKSIHQLKIKTENRNQKSY